MELIQSPYLLYHFSKSFVSEKYKQKYFSKHDSYILWPSLVLNYPFFLIPCWNWVKQHHFEESGEGLDEEEKEIQWLLKEVQSYLFIFSNRYINIKNTHHLSFHWKSTHFLSPIMFSAKIETNVSQYYACEYILTITSNNIIIYFT